MSLHHRKNYPLSEAQNVPGMANTKRLMVVETLDKLTTYLRGRGIISQKSRWNKPTNLTLSKEARLAIFKARAAEIEARLKGGGK